ncbi:MAG TPA: peptidoglycan-binding domain-containing protein [Rhodocyclaceae bacterium]|nr:peptidoglycan-binding domain-containing protein [Rhodocyclaceae bacterium]
MHVIGSLLAVCMAWFVVESASAQSDCRRVVVSAGQDVVELSGLAPPDDVVCFVVTGLNGRRVSIVVTEGVNVIFSIDGLVDAHDRYSFSATHDAYRVVVGQLMRSIDAEPFRLRIDALMDTGRGTSGSERERVAQAQALLNELGYDAGPVDGVAGRRTRRAISAFQSDVGMAVTGDIDGALLAALRDIRGSEHMPARPPQPGVSRDDSAAHVEAPAASAAPEASGDAWSGAHHRFSCTDRPPDDAFARPSIPEASGSRSEGAIYLYTDTDDVVRIGKADSAGNHFTGAGDDVIYVDGPAIATRIWGENGADTFIVCAIGEATTVIQVGPHDLAGDTVYIDEAVFADPPLDPSHIAIFGLNAVNDRVLMRAPDGAKVSFNNDDSPISLAITIGAVTVTLHAGQPIMTFDESIRRAVDIRTTDGRRVHLPPLAPAYHGLPEQIAVVGPRPLTLAGNEPDSAMGFEACPEPSAITEPSRPVPTSGIANYRHVSYGHGDDIVLHLGRPAAESVAAGAGADRVFAYDVTSGTAIGGGAGADIIMLCSPAEDGLSASVELGGTHGADIDADRLVIGSAFFEGVPEGHRRGLEVFGFADVNDRLELRVPAGMQVSFVDQQVGSALIKIGNVEVRVYIADWQNDEPFDWDSVIIVPAGFERPAVARAGQTRAAATTAGWRWSEARTVDGVAADVATLPYRCDAMQEPEATINLKQRLTDVSEIFRRGGSMDNDDWAFYSHGDDLIRFAAEDTVDSAYVKAGRGDDVVYLLDAGDGVNVLGDGGADTIVLCSMRGVRVVLSLGMDLDPDLVVIEPPVFLDVPPGFGRRIEIQGFVSVLDRLELRVPAGLSVESRVKTGTQAPVIKVGDVEISIADPYLGWIKRPFVFASIVIVRGERQ